MASKVPVRVGRYRLGNKQIFLPNFTLTLLRTPEHPPTFASFIVPLNLNKLDLRDYLWNVYGVEVRGVRSYIQQQKVRQDKPGAIRVRQRQFHRPRSIKKMLVEMESPFVWPEKPENFDLWDKTSFDAVQEFREKQSETVQPSYRTKPSSERESIAEQAKSLLKGETRWKDVEGEEDDRQVWEDDGEAVEIEEDVELSKIENK